MLVWFYRPWRKAEDDHKKYVDGIIRKAIAGYNKIYLKPEEKLVKLFLTKAQGKINSEKPEDNEAAIKIFNEISASFRHKMLCTKHAELREKSLILLKDIFNYDYFIQIKKTIWCAYNLYQKCRYKICPYCNFGSIVCNYKPDYKRKKIYRGDIDHFLPKESFPYLALSLGNLIPACPTCNSRFKLRANPAELPILNPIKDEPATNFLFRLDDNLSEISRITIKSRKGPYRKKSIESIKLFNLNGRYNHDNVIRKANGHIANLVRLSNTSYINALQAQANGLTLPRSIVTSKFDKPGNFKNMDYGRLYYELYKKFFI